MSRFYRVIHMILRPLLYLLFPISAEGLENIPAGGAVLCCNHASAWDPVRVTFPATISGMPFSR